MKKEVKSAVDFLTNILRSRDVDRVQTHFFNTTLQNLLHSRYQNHWFPDKPCKGSGYRCIRFNHSLDPIVREAGLSCGIQETTMKSFFPRELTMWVDPHEVSYRIGENGSVGVLFTSENDADQQKTSQSEDISTEETSDLNNSYNLSCKEQFLNVLPGLSMSREKSVYRFPKKNHWGKEKCPNAKSKADRIHMELQSVVDYMTNIMKPLLSSNYVVLPVLVAIPDGLSEEAEREVINSRPAHRKGKEVQSYTVDPDSKSALILPDLSYIIGYEVSPTTGATISVEIKPKKVFMHSSDSCSQTENLKRFQVCKFCMHQRLKAKEGQWPKTSRYCPLDLFSGDIERMRHSLLALADTPQNNFRICLNGEEVHGAWRKQDSNIVLETLFGPGTNGHNNGSIKPKNLQLLDLIIEALLSVPHVQESKDGESDVPLVEFPAQYCQNSSYVQQQQKHQLQGQNGKKFTLLKGCVLEQVLSVQRMDDLDIHGVFPLYQKLEEHLQHHPEESSSWRLDGPYDDGSWLDPCNRCLVQTCSSSCCLEKQYQIAEAVYKVKRFLISKTMQDCSIMVALQRVSEKTSSKYSYLTDPQGRLYQFSVSIIDLDPKPFNKILTYYRQDAKISKAYREAEDKMQAPVLSE